MRVGDGVERELRPAQRELRADNDNRGQERTMTIKVERVHDISVADLRSGYAEPGRPVIISGCIEHWPARKKWSLDYFADHFGDKSLDFSDKTWKLRDFVADLRSGTKPAPYLNQVKLDEQFQELFADIGDLKYTRSNALNSRFLPNSMRIDRGIKALFMGGAGSGFGKLHWDYSYLHVYISQVRGPKDFLIFSPDDSPFLYPKPDYPADSMVKDFNNFDIEQYPDVKKATPIRFTVNEGETVFIPAGWWHATQMRELSISLAESALDRGNWKIRKDWYLSEYHKSSVSKTKLSALRLYMDTLGLFVS
jgi:histone arginine demethylase JMJD6